MAEGVCPEMLMDTYEAVTPQEAGLGDQALSEDKEPGR